MPVPFTFGKHGDPLSQPEARPGGNAGQPEPEIARLERLREHTRAAIDDLARLRVEVEAKTLQRLAAVCRGLTGLPAATLSLGEAARFDAALVDAQPETLPGGWHAVRPDTVDEVWAAWGPSEVGTLLFTLLERVDELQGVVEWLVDRIEPVLAHAERAIARHAHAPDQPVDYLCLDAEEKAIARRLVVLGTALNLVLAVRLLQDDGTLVPGHEAFLEQVRRAAQ